MILEVRDLNYQLLDIIDAYESLIWTERYAKYGDFEVELIPTEKILVLAQIDRLVTIAESKYVMFIEQVELKTDPEQGNTLIISGRSFGSILTRRVIWPVFNKNLKLVEYCKELVKACFQSSTAGRNVQIHLLIEDSPELSEANKNTITAQHTGDNLYDALYELFSLYKIGFRFEIEDRIYTETLSNGTTVMKRGCVYKMIFYAGLDRSYNQMNRPWVVFSPRFNNIGATDDLKSVKEYATMAYIAGEETQPNRAWTTIEVESVSNPILRREIFVDARDLQSTYRDESGEEHVIPESEYTELMKTRGKERIQNYQKYHDYQAAVDTTVEHVYGTDYSLGDIIQLVNEYGVETRARVVEFIRSDGPTGYTQYPTFEIVD